MSSRHLVHGKGLLSQTYYLPASTHDAHKGNAHMFMFHKDRYSIPKDLYVVSIITIKYILSNSPNGVVDGM